MFAPTKTKKIIAQPSTASNLFNYGTCWSHQDNPDNLMEQGANYSGKDVETDGRIMTGCGPDAATDFGNAILNALNEQTKEENNYKHNKQDVDW